MNILITAGPTREFIDPVRFISNPATGRLGYLIARKAKKKGHNVFFVVGPCHLPPLKGVKTIEVVSAVEMKREVEKLFPSMDVLVMTAAVSDWRPAKKSSKKIKIKKRWTLKLVPNPDILKFVSGKKRKNQLVIGFALESTSILKNAREKLKEKKLDIIIANTVKNFGTSQNTGKIFMLYSDGKMINLSGYSKEKISTLLVKEIEKWKEKVMC